MAEKEDFLALGDRPATTAVRRMICYCWPERCRKAALRKAQREISSGTPDGGDPQ